MVRAKNKQQVSEAVEHAVLNALDDIEDRIAEGVFDRWTKAFVAKSEGGEDEFGNSWPPLSDRTVKKKRRNPPNLDHRNTLGGRLIRDLMRNGLSREQAGAKAVAILGSTFATPSEVINVDNGELIASLDPRGNENQIREQSGDAIALGTEVDHAGPVNARRRFLPTADEAVDWLYDIATELRDEIEGDILLELRKP